MKYYDNVAVSEKAEMAVVKLLSGMFNSVAYMIPEAVQHNVRAACEGGFSLEDRTFRSGTINSLLKNFVFCFIGLIIDKKFRSECIDIIKMEQDFDDLTPERQAEIRKDLNKWDFRNVDGSTIVVDFSKYDDEVFKEISGKLQDSFNSLDPSLEDPIDDLINGINMDSDALEEYGFIVSNFMYLLRAFEKNTDFFAYAFGVFTRVSQTLNRDS